MVQGKTYRPNYKIRKPVARPQKDWFRKEGTHEAIISRNDFDLVHNILDTDTHQSAGQETIYPFSGIVYCGNCHQSCNRKQTVKKTKAISIMAAIFPTILHAAKDSVSMSPIWNRLC